MGTMCIPMTPFPMSQNLGANTNPQGHLRKQKRSSRSKRYYWVFNLSNAHVEKVGVVATPDIHSFDLTDREHFIILGCDGLWGVFGPSDAVDFVQKLLKEGLPVTAVSRRLIREAVRERRCKDNCTATVIVFRRQ